MCPTPAQSSARVLISLVSWGPAESWGRHHGLLDGDVYLPSFPPPATASLGHKTGLDLEEGRSQCHPLLVIPFQHEGDARHHAITLTSRNTPPTQTTSCPENTKSHRGNRPTVLPPCSPLQSPSVWLLESQKDDLRLSHHPRGQGATSTSIYDHPNAATVVATWAEMG